MQVFGGLRIATCCANLWLHNRKERYWVSIGQAHNDTKLLIFFLRFGGADACNHQQTPWMLPMIYGVSGSGRVLVGGRTALESSIRYHGLVKYDSVEGDGSFVIFDGDFLFAVGQISLPGAPNSQFWLHSGMYK